MQAWLIGIGVQHVPDPVHTCPLAQSLGAKHWTHFPVVVLHFLSTLLFARH